MTKEQLEFEIELNFKVVNEMLEKAEKDTPHYHQCVGAGAVLLELMGRMRGEDGKERNK